MIPAIPPLNVILNEPIQTLIRNPESMNLKSLLFPTAMAVAFASTASAQVTVVATVPSASLNSSAGSTMSFTYNPVTPGNTLVFGTYNDNGALATSATFDGVAATGFITNTRTTLAYTTTSDASVNIVLNFNSNAGAASGYVLYELANVAAGAVDLATGTPITTTDAGKFVLSFTGINGGTGAGTVPAVGSIITTSAVADYNGGGGGGALAHGRGIAGLAGPQTLGWIYSNGTNNGQVSAAFPTGVNPDSDGDGLLDVWEIAQFGNLTSARGSEAQDPLLGADWDNDDDGFDNEAEETAGSNPNNPASIPGDIDGDTLADADEILYFGNLAQVPNGDFDGDYSTNIVEITAGISPSNASLWPDTDEDAMADGWETVNGLIVGTDDSGDQADADGFTNLEEFIAGTDPQNSAWTPQNAVLAHRWSFTGNLTDSVGGSNAQILNQDTLNAGFSSEQTANNVELFGGAKATSDYILLGNNLLSNLQSGGVKPVTIELWAARHAIGNWSRIWAFGNDVNGSPGTNGSLRMVWSNGTDLNTDSVEWNGNGNSNGTNAPYVVDVPYHMVMTIVPAVFTNGAITRGTTVTWYTAPVSDSQSAGHPLNVSKGTFNTTADLRDLIDSVCYLGRSMWPDTTASATYDEMRIWKGALTETERELFQLIGPDSIDRSDVDNGGLGDGFPDQWEIARFGDTDTATPGGDADLDGEEDDVEFANESNPDDVLSTLADRDKDNLADVWEMQYFKNLLQVGESDADGDLISNEDEETYGSNPFDANSSPDNDGDGIPDGWELTRFGDLVTADSTLRSGGVNTNYDGDLDNDLQEYQGGFDPTNRFSGRDTDGDQLPDYWEYFYFSPAPENTGAGLALGGSYLILNGSNDPDLDTATNFEELADGTNPAAANDVRDSNGDGFYDGTLLAATDGFGATSFNLGTNWTGALAPVTGKNYLVPAGLRLRTPNQATASLTFAGNKLAFAGELGLKGDGSTFAANYVFASGSSTPSVISIVDAGGTVTLGGTVQIQTASTLSAQNGALAFSALVSGSGALNLVGPNAIQFNNASNTYSGDITMGSTARLVVNGVLNSGTGSVFNVAPGEHGVSNSISGTGTLGLAGSLNINLSGVVPSQGASWNLVTTATVSFDESFTVTGSGFTSGGGLPGERVWTDASGNYEFEEASGVLTYVGVLAGYGGWAGDKGLVADVNDGVTQNPDYDSFANILEYQLNGDPLGFDGDLVQTSEDATYLIFNFERYDLSEADSTMTFQWGANLGTWNDVVIGDIGATDVNGVVVTVGEDLGASGADYDAITVKVPKSLNASGKLFGRLQGVSQP